MPRGEDSDADAQAEKFAGKFSGLFSELRRKSQAVLEEERQAKTKSILGKLRKSKAPKRKSA